MQGSPGDRWLSAALDYIPERLARAGLAGNGTALRTAVLMAAAHIFLAQQGNHAIPRAISRQLGQRPS